VVVGKWTAQEDFDQKFKTHHKNLRRTVLVLGLSETSSVHGSMQKQLYAEHERGGIESEESV
jgi:hypothetical protein